MSRLTAFPVPTAILLVLLRLAIGWHFFYEGALKVRSHYLEDTAYSKPFSSAGYFRESTGVLGDVFRKGVGDPDDEALARLEVRPPPEGQDMQNDRPHLRVPPQLQKDWEDYVGRFIAHYGLDDVKRQQAEAKLEQAEAKVVLWLTEAEVTREEVKGGKEKTREVTRKYLTGEFKYQQPAAERVAEYRAKVAALRALPEKNRAFGRDVAGADLRRAKAEVADLRTGLLKDLDDHTAGLTASLRDLVPKEQLDDPGPKPLPGPSKAQTRLDWLTRWGLTAMGACLLLGLLTRINCVLAAGFLLTTILLTPSLPWLPAAPQSEGNYLIVNKNVIEMLALLVLATTASGRWFGVDAWLHGLGRAAFGRRPEPAPRGPIIHGPPPGTRSLPRT